jgi:hypothetical protein
MPLAIESDTDCVKCGSSNVFEFTKAGESKKRLECDDCLAQWSDPA